MAVLRLGGDYLGGCFEVGVELFLRLTPLPPAPSFQLRRVYVLGSDYASTEAG